MVRSGKPRPACRVYSGPEWAQTRNQTLRISETFVSVQGEGTRSGRPTFFIRLTGCALRCRWCDTTYAFKGGETLSLESLEKQFLATGLKQVCVTGGEPLLQAGCTTLVERLISAHGADVCVETGGDQPIAGVPLEASVILDVKLPGSGMADRMDPANLERLTSRDEVKLVIADRQDYEAAREVVAGFAGRFAGEVLFSAVHGQLEPATLAEWVLADRLAVRLQVQFHKVLWPGAGAGR